MRKFTVGTKVNNMMFLVYLLWSTTVVLNWCHDFPGCLRAVECGVAAVQSRDAARVLFY